MRIDVQDIMNVKTNNKTTQKQCVGQQQATCMLRTAHGSVELKSYMFNKPNEDITHTSIYMMPVALVFVLTLYIHSIGGASLVTCFMVLCGNTYRQKSP